MKNRILLLAALALAIVAGPLRAQSFFPGQLLTSQQMNNAFALMLPKAGGTLLGALNGPSASFNNATFGNVTISGGTINGLAAPVPVGSGGTGAATALAATANLQFLAPYSGAVVRSVQSKLNDILNVADYNPGGGALCNNGANGGDTNQFLAALAAAGVVGAANGATVNAPVGACVIGAVTVPQNVVLAGTGKNSTTITPSAANINPLISLAGNFSGVRDLTFNGVPGSTTDLQILFNTSSLGQFVDNVWMNGQCHGIDLQGNTSWIDHTDVRGVSSGSNCFGIRVGAGTTGAGTVDPRITNTTVASNSPASGAGPTGILIVDAGGLYMSNNDVIGGQYGTRIYPGANQAVTWTFFSNTVLGDTTYGNAFSIDTGASTAIVKSVSGDGVWASCNGCARATIGTLPGGVYIANNGGGTVTGVHLKGRFYGNSGDGIDVYGANVSNVTLDNAHICGTSSSGSDVYVSAAMNGLAVRDSTVGANCDGQTGGAAIGLNINPGATDVIATGNDYTGVTTPIASIPTSAVVGPGPGYANFSQPGGTFTTGITVNGGATMNSASGNPTAVITVNGASNSNGAGVLLAGNGGTTPNKYIRASGGGLQILNSAYSASIFSLTDAGAVTIPGGATISGSLTATGLVTTADLATQAANTVLANVTGSTASPTAFAVPSCSTASSALQWTSGTGFTCSTSINAATLGGATFAAPGPIGSTTPNSGAFTTLSASTQINVSHMAVSGTAPTISSGFGTSPSITASNGTAAFRVNVGTGGSATSGVISLPAATAGWNCVAQDISSPTLETRETASSTTSVTFGNYNGATSTAWNASDILAVNCVAL